MTLYNIKYFKMTFLMNFCHDILDVSHVRGFRLDKGNLKVIGLQNCLGKF